jgi:hypothetical protein
MNKTSKRIVTSNHCSVVDSVQWLLIVAKYATTASIFNQYSSLAHGMDDLGAIPMHHQLQKIPQRMYQ